MPVNERIKKLLAALNQSPSNWLSRKEVAALIGTAVLSPSDSVLLEVMAGQNLIEMREAPSRANLTRWEYRAKGETMKEREWAHVYALKRAANLYDVQFGEEGQRPGFEYQQSVDLPNTHGDKVTIVISFDESLIPSDVLNTVKNQAISLVSRARYGRK